MKNHEFEKIVTKLELKSRNTDHLHVWFEYEGKVVTRTKKSHGSGFDLPAHLIRQQLKLNEKQLSGLIKCTLYKSDYIEILKQRGLIK